MTRAAAFNRKLSASRALASREARMAYRTADNPDRIKAIAAVLIVHAGLAAVILSGLNVHLVGPTIERLKTFDITEAPPQPLPPPPSPTPDRAREKEGAAAKKALPTPVVAPPPRIVVPTKPPVTAARIASTGSAATAGAATAGTGTGAGGSGTGSGGGGAGTGTGGGSGPRLVSGGPTRSDYRRLGARVAGPTRAIVRLNIGADGHLANCALVASSGYSDVDARLCPLLKPRMRWAPARDTNGRAIPSWVDFVVTLNRY